MKTVFKLLMTFAIISMSNEMHAYDFESGDFGYNIISLDEMTCELAGVINECPSHVTIPESATYKGRELKVIKVGSECFKDRTNLVSASLHSSIREIGDGAFYGCLSLKTINIPNGIKELSSSLFWGCKNLASINLPNSLLTIDTLAFCGCSSLASIILPNKLKSIRTLAFSWTAIVSLDIPDSVSEIDIAAFSFCDQIQEIAIGSGLQSLTEEGYSFITECKNLQRLIIKDPKDPKYPMDRIRIDMRNDSFRKELTELPINELYLGRKLDVEGHGTIYDHAANDQEFKSLQKITFGYYFNIDNEDYTWINLKKLPKTATIYCKNQTPPNPLGTFFSNEQYLYCVLYVPTESIDVYKNAEGWKNFWDIRGFDFSSGIEDVTENTRDVYNVYNIHGNYILRTRNKEDINKLQKGIYIINGKKVMIP